MIHWLFISLFLNIAIVKSELVEAKYNEIFPIVPNYVLNSTNTECVQHSVLYLENFQNYTKWAFQMWDASSKTPIAQMVADSINIGHFDECLTANAPFDTQHCLIDVKLTLEQPPKTNEETIFDSILTPTNRFRNVRNFYRNGICLPKSCDYMTLKNYLVTYFDNYSMNNEMNISYEVSFPPNACQVNEREEFDIYDILFCVVISVFVVLVIISSILQSYLNLKSNSFLGIIIQSFSLKHTVVNDLLKTDENNLKYLHGLKVFSITWVIFGHGLALSHAGVIYDYRHSEGVYNYLLNYVVLRGDLWVDTFFIVSGLLLSYLSLCQFEKGKKLNPAMLVILRYLRLTPLYAIVVFFFATIYTKLGNGPLYHLILDDEKQTCRENWWLNLLYISNYVNTNRTCIPTSWFLPCDLHFFIIGVLIVKLINKNHQYGLLTLGIIAFTSMIASSVLTFINNWDGVVLFTIQLVQQPRNDTVFNERYNQSHLRIATYLVGIVLGYILYTQKNSNIQLNKRKSILFGTSAGLTLILLIVSSRLFYVSNFPYPFIAAIFAGFHRLIWAIAISVIIFCFEYGKLDTIKNLLSSYFLTILSKLTYAVYLVHPAYLLHIIGTQRVPYVEGDFALINRALQIILMSYIIAFFGYIMIEAPLRNIIKLTLYPPKDKKTSSFLNLTINGNDKNNTDVEKNRSSVTKC
ncbi:nose resistant to fluoxetine protein 6-like [Chrysoperla carnea]|uniref:nose resistant to fluoxetine protein 6-like n=1 Tax=Chrysoperla carnea TaxID=189513 RepID=UPI001D074372|nr:nose resistant to fluoxetine protein 6-like [Chrysoperla carnea]